MSPYRVWRLADEERVRLEDMMDCCRIQAEQTTSYEAEFECPVCQTEWRAG